MWMEYIIIAIADRGQTRDSTRVREISWKWSNENETARRLERWIGKTQNHSCSLDLGHGLYLLWPRCMYFVWIRVKIGKYIFTHISLCKMCRKSLCACMAIVIEYFETSYIEIHREYPLLGSVMYLMLFTHLITVLPWCALFIHTKTSF